MYYFDAAYKHTQEIILENDSFFVNLKDIEKVFVLGHSLSAVDIPYFEKIIDAISNKNIPCQVSVHRESEKEEKANRLLAIGIKAEQFSLFNMDELKIIKSAK